MEIRTFKGRELNTVMGIVKDSIGEDAMIVSTRQLPDKTVEVDVAIETYPTVNSSAALREVWSDTRSSFQPPEQHPAYELLLDCGFKGALLERICSSLNSGLTFQSQLVDALKDIFAFDPSLLPYRSGGPRVVAFVGPTGVGKTTTLAKLAAQIRLAFDLKVALVSADAFRIGAAHQLQTYAALLKMPCRTICPPGMSRIGSGMLERIDEALSEFSNYDLILVDTSGVGARDKERLRLLQESLKVDQFIERFLVLQANSNDRDLSLAAEAFAPLQYSRLVVTKMDETSYVGPILNLASKLKLPFGFFCTGQKVPEDIEPATPKRLAWMISQRIN